jgi:hypothetical protein
MVEMMVGLLGLGLVVELDSMMVELLVEQMVHHSVEKWEPVMVVVRVDLTAVQMDQMLVLVMVELMADLTEMMMGTPSDRL